MALSDEQRAQMAADVAAGIAASDGWWQQLEARRRVNGAKWREDLVADALNIVQKIEDAVYGP